MHIYCLLFSNRSKDTRKTLLSTLLTQRWTLKKHVVACYSLHVIMHFVYRYKSVSMQQWCDESCTSGDLSKHSAQIRINFCIQTQVYCWKTLWTQTLTLSNVNILKHMTSTILLLLIWSQLDHLKKLRFFFFLLEYLHTSLKKKFQAKKISKNILPINFH